MSDISSPVKVTGFVKTLLDTIGEEAEGVGNGRIDPEKGRILLGMRKAQIRGVEVTLSVLKLNFNLEKERKRAGRKKIS